MKSAVIDYSTGGSSDRCGKGRDGSENGRARGHTGPHNSCGCTENWAGNRCRVENGGSIVENGGSTVENGGNTVENGGSSIVKGGSTVVKEGIIGENGGSSIENGSSNGCSNGGGNGSSNGGLGEVRGNCGNTVVNRGNRCRGHNRCGDSRDNRVDETIFIQVFNAVCLLQFVLGRDSCTLPRTQTINTARLAIPSIYLNHRGDL